MANESPYDNRNIVEKYLKHKLSKNGYVWEFRALEPDPASSSNGLCPARVNAREERGEEEEEEEEEGEEEEEREEDKKMKMKKATGERLERASRPLTITDRHAALLRALREAGDELERMYKPDFTEMSKQLQLTTAASAAAAVGNRRFAAVIDELFRDGVNWGRVIAFFEFGATVCVECADKEMTSQVDNIAGWMTEYLNGPLYAWIQENGGWDAFVELYGRQRDSVFSSSWPSIATVFSLTALGAVGFTIGAYLAQK